MDDILKIVVWLFAFTVANWAYYDFIRKGERGFKRLVAFWMGWPATFVSLLAVRERTELEMREDDEGLRELVGEIRRDRLGRAGGGGALPPGERGEPGRGPASDRGA